MGKKNKDWMRMVMIFAMVIELVLIHVSNGDLQRFEQPAKADGSLAVLVVGDWGRKGDYNQSRLAHQMGVTTENLDIDFVISTGDNFYDDGLTNTFDPAFDQSFTDIYTAPSLQKTWYNVLGNHDYRGDALAQLSPILKARDKRWFCMKSFILDTGIAEFFFIDTTPFQDKYFTNPEDHVYDWRGVIPRDKYLSTLLQDLEMGLIESQAKWKIVVGHHTIKSASDHGNTQELVDKVLPILEIGRKSTSGESTEMITDGEEESAADFWPVQHPIAPPPGDKPVECPFPNSSLINEYRFSKSSHRRGAEPMSKRRHSVSHDGDHYKRLLFPDKSHFLKNTFNTSTSFRFNKF